MTYDEALHSLMQACLVDVDWCAGGGGDRPPGAVAADARCRAYDIEKAIYDRGFAAAAGLHAELSSPSQPR